MSELNAAEAAKGSQLTKTEVLETAKKLMKKYRIPEDFVHYEKD